MHKYRLSLLLCCSLVVTAPLSAAESIVLQCEGSFPTYPDGFGAPIPESQGKAVRLVEIDLQVQTASLQTLFGHKRVPLNKSADDKYFSFTVKHNVQYKGKTISEEQVSINRYTGEINALYTFEPKLESSLGYSAFSGVCKKATRQF